MRSRLTLFSLTLLVLLAATVLDGRTLIDRLAGRLRGEDRTLRLVSTAGARPSGIDRQIETLQARLKTRPRDAVSLVGLGAAYLQKARETGDPAYYSRAESVLTLAREVDPHDVDALNQLGVLALARHQFTRALALGEQARALNPDKALTLGIIADAQVELGRYDEAVQTVQAMVDLRPDLSSYARVAYIRELYGDMPGAADAMQRAVRAGGPAAENTAWTQVQLGLLHFNQGDLDSAEREFRAALVGYPGYIPAVVGLARVEAGREEWDAAITLLRQAVDQMPLPEYAALLGDVLTAAGRPDEAQPQYALVRAVQQLHQAQGVTLDLEMALFAADHNDTLAATVERARAAYQERPGIYGADVLAWALFKAGHVAEARDQSRQALRLGTRDALLHYHAGLIALAAGDAPAAQAYLAAALSINPYFSPVHVPCARAALDLLRNGEVKLPACVRVLNP